MLGFGVNCLDTRNPFDQCASFAELSQTLTDFSGRLGVPFFSYLMVQSRHDQTMGDDVLLTNYDPQWCERYLERCYKHYDPVALLTRQSRLPFFWDNKAFLRPFRKEQRQVFYEARSFDIKAGYSIPMSGPNGDIGVFSLVGAKREHVDDAVRSAGPEILLTSMQAHDRAVSLSSRLGTETALPSLTGRELECLRWTAEGKTSDEIAHAVSIAPATVNYHLSKAVIKLGASNRHHAAIKAVRLGLIA